MYNTILNAAIQNVLFLFELEPNLIPTKYNKFLRTIVLIED